MRPLEPEGSFEKSLPGVKDFGSLPDGSQPFNAKVYGATGEKRGKITVVDWAMKKAPAPLSIPVRIRWDDGGEEQTSTEMINVTPDGSYSSANLFHLMLMRDYHRRRLEGKDLTEPALKLTAVKNMLGNWWLQTELSRKQDGEIAKTKLEAWRKDSFHEGTGADFGLLPPEGYVAMEPALDRSSIKPLPPLEFELTNPNALPPTSILKKYRMFAYRENRTGIFAFSVFRKDPAVRNAGK